MESGLFKTDRRIRLGIWGLGRGGAFVDSCRFLNIDVVAGCDYNPVIREQFRKENPRVMLTDDEDEFLAMDIDAVLVATFFTEHGRHAVKALKAGRHVMSEVTSFFTPAQGVELVEAVESSGKTYMLLENYPFSRENMYAKRLWDEGFFGDLMYAEYNYVHECRSLGYTYINGAPVEPGWTCHSWRSWLNSHYYNTHSLGPVMNITGTRPVSVSAKSSDTHLAGYIPGAQSNGIAPALFKMDNGGIVRNLMGATTRDCHDRRLFGTLAAADLTHGFSVCLGASGHGHWFDLNPPEDEKWELAAKAGHGGGDFWELYFFAREILTGKPNPWTIYKACDVTLAGIMSFKSSLTDCTEEIPDFRDKAVRERYRHDNFVQEHFDPEHIFPEGHDTELTKDFTTVMKDFEGLILARSVFDCMKIRKHLASDKDIVRHENDVRSLISALPGIAANLRKARRLMNAYPDCPAGKAIAESLSSAYEDKILDTDRTIQELKEYLVN